MLHKYCNTDVLGVLLILSLGRCVPSGVIRIYQSNSLPPCYNILIAQVLQLHLLQHMAKEPGRVVVEDMAVDLVVNVAEDMVVVVAEDMAAKLECPH